MSNFEDEKTINKQFICEVGDIIQPEYNSGIEDLVIRIDKDFVYVYRLRKDDEYVTGEVGEILDLDMYTVFTYGKLVRKATPAELALYGAGNEI